MDDNEIEVLAVSSENEKTIKMPGSKLNLGHKRRRSATPMRPVAIAPKTNFSTSRHQHIELAIKSEPGFITIIPKPNQIPSENEQGNKSIAKLDQHEIIESLTGLQNPKRIKLGTDDVPMQYIILQNQSLDNCNTILLGDSEEKMVNREKAGFQEFAMIRNNMYINSSQQQRYVGDISNLVNCRTLSASPKLNFDHQDHISITLNTERLNFNSQKNNLNELPQSCSPQNCNVKNISDPEISGNITTNNMIGKSNILNVASTESLEILDTSKCRPQKPVVIMQQQLSPPNRTSFVKPKRLSNSTLNKLLPLDTQAVNVDTKILPKQASPSKSNEIYYESKTMNHTAIRVHNDEQETDFLLKKEFPVISSSQVDSVLKAIDFQGLNRGTVSNEIVGHSKKQAADKDAPNIERLLPCIQDAAKLCNNENAQWTNTVIDPLNKTRTNQPAKRFSSERQAENYSKAVENLVDTLQYYKCKECSYMCLTENHIFEHIKREHINVSKSKKKPILRCPGCSNTFHYEASLLSHIVHDHQVHESEAEIIVQQLFYRQNLPVDSNNPKPISQIRITKTRNEEMFIAQASDPLFEHNEQPEILSPIALPKITTVTSLQASPQSSENNAVLQSGALQYVQNINNTPVIVGSSLGAVDVRNVPLLNEVKTFQPKSEVQQNQQPKVLEIKNVECSDKLNLYELKSVDERNFEFVNFANVAQGDDESYLQEDDPMERGISDSEMEFIDLPSRESAPDNSRSETRTVKIKRKGRPKGSKSYSTKSQPVNLKQGYKCEVEDCGVRMLVQENIVYHQKCHIVTTILTNLSFQCPECIEFKSNNWNNLAGHLWRSHIIDMELHSCDLCSYKTPSLSNLMNQHKGIHGDDRPFLCDNCGKGFKTRKQLRNHRALHSAKAKQPSQCDKCKRHFTNTRLLKLHKDSVHKESKPFTCSSCSYSAATRSTLKLHMRRHTGEKPFSCEQCSYSTGDHNSLRRHKLRHLGLKPYSCPHCSYACIQSSTYKVHLKNRHPGLDHDLMFSCQYCSYKSVKKDNLLTHMAKHEQASSKESMPSSGSPVLVE